MNDVKSLIRAAECAKMLPDGPWLFTWFSPIENMLVAFAHQQTGEIVKGFWSEQKGSWLESSLPPRCERLDVPARSPSEKPYPDYDVLHRPLASGPVAHPVPSTMGTLHFREASLTGLTSAERGAVAGQPGWFWWTEVAPPPNVMVDVRRERGNSIQRMPSQQSPASLHGLMWRIAK